MASQIDYDDEKLGQKKITWGVFAKFTSYLTPYKWKIAANMVINLLSTASMLAAPHIIKIAVDRYIFTGDLKGIFFISMIFLANLLIGWLLSVTQINWTIRLGESILNDVRLKVFRHIQTLSMNYFDRVKQGRIIARADSDITAMEHVVTWGSGIFLNSCITLIGAFYFMSRYDWHLSLAVSSIIPFLIVATDIFRRKGMKSYRKVRESMARITANIAENISGVRVVQSFVREYRNLSQFEKINIAHTENTVRAARIWSIYFPSLALISGIGMSIIFGYGGYLVSRGQLKIGELSAYILYLSMFFTPIFMMGELYNSMLSATAAVERIFTLLDTSPTIKDHGNAIDFPIKKGEVSFENVYFSYTDNDDENWILKNINFKANTGETIAFVGRTGTGKSSIINLIARFYEPQKGKIKIDGYDLNKIKLGSLHSQMGIVLQENFLFSGTVMSNLKYGRPYVTDEEVIEAARTIGSHEFIEKLANGYQTEVKERGVGISEGEKQLICFTRALIANPKILILDEATSSVDTHTELVLQQALSKLTAQRTSFIVAQRLSTIRKANNVLVIKDGKIAESGTHRCLLKRNGIYAKMYEEFVRKK